MANDKIPIEPKIAHTTRHASNTDGTITSFDESVILQQALLQIPTYDGKNMPLKSFIQKVDIGLALVPHRIQHLFFNGVRAQLQNMAKAAVINKTTNDLQTLKNALNKYFLSKKSYPQYCADLQAVRLQKNESVSNYYHRIKQIRANAIESLKEHFDADGEVDTMTKLLDGIVLESFKRGFHNNLLYGVSVKNSATLDEAYETALRLENDLKTRTNYFGNDERRNSIPYRFSGCNNSRSASPRRRYNPQNRRSYRRDNSRSRQDNYRRYNSAYRSRTISPPRFYSHYPHNYFLPMVHMPNQMLPSMSLPLPTPYENPYPNNTSNHNINYSIQNQKISQNINSNNTCNDHKSFQRSRLPSPYKEVSNLNADQSNKATSSTNT